MYYVNLAVARHDDMESFFYLLMYLLKGELPWLKGASVYNRQLRIGFKETRNMKLSYKPEEMWLDLPCK
jgi:hypothetical protein